MTTETRTNDEARVNELMGQIRAEVGLLSAGDAEAHAALMRGHLPRMQELHNTLTDETVRVEFLGAIGGARALIQSVDFKHEHPDLYKAVNTALVEDPEFDATLKVSTMRLLQLIGLDLMVLLDPRILDHCLTHARGLAMLAAIKGATAAREAQVQAEVGA